MLLCLAFTGFVLSSLALSSCRFLQISSVIVNNNAGGDFSINAGYAGIFRIITPSGLCVPYDVLASQGLVQTSSSIKAARAFGVAAALLGGITVLAMLSAVFLGAGRALWITYASLLTACTVFQLLLFLVFNDDECKSDQNFPQISVKCSFDEGAAYAISACLFYLVSAVGMFATPPPRAPLVRIKCDWAGEVEVVRVTSRTAGDEETELLRGQAPENQLTTMELVPLPAVVEVASAGGVTATDVVS